MDTETMTLLKKVDKINEELVYPHYGPIKGDVERAGEILKEILVQGGRRIPPIVRPIIQSHLGEVTESHITAIHNLGQEHQFKSRHGITPLMEIWNQEYNRTRPCRPGWGWYGWQTRTQFCDDPRTIEHVKQGVQKINTR